ncbi:response regulator [Eudoraea chungangensis]|uniref:response regulator n=1 Tax=Eudoraea chungangensis TaxID=1481905 RepID=UPI0023EB7716|nr:response regulator [Eudoraea chungangensis]
MDVITVLAVDDHEMTTLGYKFILEDIDFKDYKVKVETAKTYVEAIEKINNSIKRAKGYDVLLLDIQLSNGNEENSANGEDLGIYARKHIPTTKIVFMSSFSDNYRINSILSTVDPEGYMVKTEIDKKSLEIMIPIVLHNPPFYSQKALAAIRKKMANDDIVLDENDKKILYHLSRGIKTKDMVNYVSLSLPSIENRKRHLKSLFGVEKQTDQALIIESQKRGFL